MKNTAKIMTICFVFLAIGVKQLYALESFITWENAYGGLKNDWAKDVLLTADGNVVVVGTTYSFGAGNTDVYLLKTDTNGVQLWEKTFGTPEYEYGNAIRLTSDDGLTIAGWKSYEPWINYAKLLFIKADSGGNEVWSNEFAYDTGIYATSVVEALDAGYVAVGSCHKHNSSKVGLLKTNSAGNKIWLKVYDSPLSYSEYATHVERTPDGGFILCGRESDNTGRGFLLKTDQNNDLQWREIYFNDSHGLVFTCVRLRSDGNYIVSGYTHWNYHYDGHIAKIDQGGNMLWSREYDWEGEDELFTSIIETGTDEYVICGYTKNPYKAICLKVNSYGNVLWKKVLDNADNAMAVIKANDNTLFLVGKTSKLGGEGDEDIYLAKIQEPVVSTPLLYAEPNELLFVSSFDYNRPIIQTAEIYNQGVGVLNWHIQEDCNWLDVTPASGSSMGDINEIQISVDKTDLDVGTYTYDVQVIDSNAVNSPYIIKVKLIIHEYTVDVPDEFDTIQQAIDAVSDGGTVIVGPGIHEGEGNYDVDFKGKAITVQGADPNDPNVVALTIIDGSSINDHQYHNGFYFHSEEDSNSMLLGLSIKGFSGNGIAISNARPVIQKCQIYGNKNGISGVFSPSDKIETLISDCSITQNKGTGIDVVINNVKIDNCIISNNKYSGVAGSGGGSKKQGQAGGSGILENCSISQNGYIGLELGGSVFLNKCSIIGNKGDNGGGICSSGNLTVENSLIAGNYSKYNGGAIVFYGPITLKNCTITGNHTERNYAISCNSYYGADIKNCLIRDNYPDSRIRFRGSRNNFISYCDIEGGINSIQLDDGAILNWGEGNIDADPCFVDPNNDDYHLLEDSNCIDAGDPNYVPTLGETDLDGNPRIIGPRVDMGAYEFNPPIEAHLRILPRVISRSSRRPRIMAIIRLPEGITKDQVDGNTPFTLYPGGIESIYQRAIQYNRRRTPHTIIFALFSKGELMDAVTDDGRVELEVIGNLKTGQYFYGTDTVWIRSRRWLPRPHRY